MDVCVCAMVKSYLCFAENNFNNQINVYKTNKTKTAFC